MHLPKILLITGLLVSLASGPLFSQTPTTIAVIGCHNQHEPAPVLPFLANEVRPEYCVWVGDNVYADTEDNPQHIEDQLKVLDTKPGYPELKANAKFFVTWDDHDYGLNNAGKEYPLKEASKQIHRKFWELEAEIPEDQDGVYYASIEKQPNGKTIQFILLDVRYNLDEPGRKADALGENQWKWLETQLQQPADLRFLVSGQQILINRPTRWEAWSRLGKSRKRLFDLIQSTQAKGVVFITGDQHYVEVLRSKKVLGYDGYEIMAAGINKVETPGLAFNRVAGPDKTIHSAPVIRVYWEEKEGVPPHLEFTVTDVEAEKITTEYRIPFSEIGLTP